MTKLIEFIKSFKFTPSIVIWEVVLELMEDQSVSQRFYFLSYRRAKKFVERNEDAFKDYYVCIGGEQLWLW